MALQSPGVDIKIIEEEIGATAGPGTVPLVIIATAENKLTEAGTLAEGTLPENAGKLELITSQRELLQKYGVPYFRSVDGTVIQADESNEYGLHAAFSYLGLANRAYVLRADLDTSQLLPTETAPRGKPTNGSYWFDFTNTSYGIFVANGNPIPALAWDSVTPLLPSLSEVNRTTGEPLEAFGEDGDFAVVTQFTDNSVYQKMSGSWLKIGTTDWAENLVQTQYVSTVASFVATATTANLAIDGQSVTIPNGATVSDVITLLHGLGLTDVTIQETAPGIITIAAVEGQDVVLTSTGTALSDYGFEKTAYSAALTYDTHINVPSGARVGSVWVKTTSPNNGADFKVYRYNASLDQFQPISAPVYANDTAANMGYAAARVVGSLYVQYVSGSFYLRRWQGGMWEQLSYEASVEAPTSNPDEGTLWFNAALEADIMVNTGNQWRGYRNVYPATDPNGPQITSEMPTYQSTGAPLANYDLWINSDESLDYPKMYRYINGSWTLIDNTDKTTPFGVIFGDIRENTGPVGPWIKGGVAATATASLKAVNAYISNPGSGYSDGNYTATVIGGTNTAPTTLSVVVAGGEVISVTVATAGNYTALPVGGTTVSVTGITGSPTVEAEFNISWGLSVVTVTSGGAGYTSEPIVNIVGGGGIGGEAYTTLDAGEVDSVVISTEGTGYTSIPRVLINTPFGKPESDDIQDLLVSDWCDPVELDVLNPQLFPAGIILFNTRRSTNNVKVWRGEYFDGVAEYTVGNFLSDAYELANPGAQDAAYTYINNKPERWVTFSGNDLDGVGLFGRFARRICVVRALAEQAVSNEDIRSEFINYNIVTAPGYPELLDELITLNTDRGETAFIIADTPVDLKPSATSIVNWANNAANAPSNGRKGRTTLYDYAAMYYPWGLGTNVDGTEIVVPASTIALRTYGYNDSVAYPWFPPAGTRRGVISNASSVGWVNLDTNVYTSVTLNQGQRDALYENKINPLTYVNGRGLLVYGDKTLATNDESPLSRVNVARLVVYLRTVLPQMLAPFLFELNTQRTREAAQNVVTQFLAGMLGNDAISDFVVSLESNTPDTIDANELWVDVAIAPTRSINFIIVPIRLKQTGSI